MDKRWIPSVAKQIYFHNNLLIFGLLNASKEQYRLTFGSDSSMYSSNTILCFSSILHIMSQKWKNNAMYLATFIFIFFTYSLRNLKKDGNFILSFHENFSKLHFFLDFNPLYPVMHLIWLEVWRGHQKALA